MSSNRLKYDKCAYEKALQQSTSQIDYHLYNGKFENCAKCRVEFGTLGGNGVSLFSGNLVDLESDLRGQTRMASLCPKTMYNPNEQKPVPLVHQASCQMQYYPKVPIPEGMKPMSCNYNGINK
jgi:hypothetical protein